MSRVYTLREIKDGTGFDRDARFLAVSSESQRYNPSDEVPLRITAEALRALRNAADVAAGENARLARESQNDKARSTFERAALLYRGLSADCALAMDRPAEHIVGESLRSARLDAIAADRSTII